MSDTASASLRHPGVERPVPSDDRGRAASVAAPRSRLERVMTVEWLGETAASLCWIASVFVYGIRTRGDWLQLCAASAWLLSNVAAIATVQEEHSDPGARHA